MSHDVPIRVDHVGVVVESVAEAEGVLQALGSVKLRDERVPPGSEPPPDGAARFRWAYYRLGDASRLELVEPLAEDTALMEYLDANGPGLHHVTLEVADLDAVVNSLEADGLRVVDRAEFADWTEAFVSPRNPTGALFQLMEYHDSYHEGRQPPSELYVNGARVGEAETPSSADERSGRRLDDGGEP